MNGNRLPWEIHPALTEPRLRFVARVIRDVRQKLMIDVFAPDQGDDRWSMGCMAYRRQCFALSKASETGPSADWLGVVDGNGLRFIFSLGGVPLRFYAGDSDKRPPNNTLTVHAPELEARQLSLFSEQDESEKVLRLIVEIDGEGLVEKITFVQITEAGDIFDPFEIPLEGPAVLPLSGGPKPVELEPLRVAPRRKADDEKSEQRGQSA
jgi:hypothetical protein